MDPKFKPVVCMNHQSSSIVIGRGLKNWFMWERSHCLWQTLESFEKDQNRQAYKWNLFVAELTKELERLWRTAVTHSMLKHGCDCSCQSTGMGFLADVECQWITHTLLCPINTSIESKFQINLKLLGLDVWFTKFKVGDSQPCNG